jgi:hypothetical protein
MKDILPFIIAIAFFAYKQYKKNESKSLPLVEDEIIEDKTEPTPSLYDFIGSFFGEQVLKEEYHVEKDKDKSEVEFESSNNVKHEPSKESYSIDFNRDDSEEKEEKLQFEMIQNKEEDELQLPDFDLRNAIIYDAILNPPYIS